MKKNEYNTKQKEQILNAIKEKKNFTIKELELILPQIGQTTIYREINRLSMNNQLIKIVNKNSVISYQYINKCDCHHHMYLKCSECGEMIHIDCDFIDKLKKHIKLDHGFELFTDDLIVSGKCKKCWKKGKSCI